MNRPSLPPVPPLANESFGDLVRDEVVRLGIQNVLGEKHESRWARLFAHPLSNTFLQFLLIAVFGGLIARALQEVADRHKREAEIREVRRSAAEKVFRDVSAGMDRRLYWSSRYQDALVANDRAEIVSSRARMDSTAVDWNTSLNTNTAMLCIYFGPTYSRYYAEQVSPTLDRYSATLKSMGTDPRVTVADLNDKRLHLQQAIYALDLRLADRIRDGKVSNEGGAGQACMIPPSFSQLLPVQEGSVRLPANRG
jgi:hypothetical protein